MIDWLEEFGPMVVVVIAVSYAVHYGWWVVKLVVKMVRNARKVK